MARSSRKPAGGQWLEHRVGSEDQSRTVQDILLERLGLSKRMLQRLTRSKGVRLNGRAAFLGRRVREGDVVSARVASAEEAQLAPVEMPLSVLYEDADLLVIDKPPFLIVHPVAKHHTRTLAHGIAFHFARGGLQARVRPVHRLDRDTSGAVLIAKSAFSHQHLDRQLREGELRREYIAIVAGAPEAERGVIDAPIARDPADPALRVVAERGGDPALTRFEVVERLGSAAMLRVQLETGRTHQIRVHLAHLGHAVIGDAQYGTSWPGLERQALHAARIEFRHPRTAEAVRVDAPLPADLSAVLHVLRREAEPRS